MLDCFSSIAFGFAGLTILTQGGNAVDSAITTALCQGIKSPAASGLGGGNFMIIRSPNGTTEVIDAREVAPAAASENMFKGLLTSLLICCAVKSSLAGLCADTRWRRSADGRGKRREGGRGEGLQILRCRFVLKQQQSF